ncbi:hypothetical protein TNCV_4501821 [Trichonephila clavipes]|nr:hypothetical protein TNCV_4501821 [Trichonephila clavipes]
MVEYQKRMHSVLYAEIANETPIKTITFSNSLHCLEIEKTYLMQKDLKNAIFSLHNVEKKLFRVRNQKDCLTSVTGLLSRFLLTVLLGHPWGQNGNSFQPTQEDERVYVN